MTASLNTLDYIQPIIDTQQWSEAETQTCLTIHTNKQLPCRKEVSMEAFWINGTAKVTALRTSTVKKNENEKNKKQTKMFSNIH